MWRLTITYFKFEVFAPEDKSNSLNSALGDVRRSQASGERYRCRRICSFQLKGLPWRWPPLEIPRFDQRERERGRETRGEEKVYISTV